MDFRISNKVALVCGSSKGLGFACAKSLADEGVKVILLSRNEEQLLSRTKQLKEAGKIAEYIKADLSKISEINSIVDKAMSIYGQIDILINNAGGPPAGPNLSFSAEKWEEAFRLTFLSAEEITKIILPQMAKRGWGRIINLTSVTVKQPIDSLILSNSIRMAIIGWAKSLSIEFASKGITINNIATGYTLTERIEGLAKDISKNTGKNMYEVIKDMVKGIPMGRMANPEEVASIVTFLASENASYITGTTIPVDGGYILGS